MVKSFYVLPFSDRLKNRRILGNSSQADYLIKYLKNSELDPKTCVLETSYIDKDYLLDYQKFYSRSFWNHGRFTKRLHFFDKEISKKGFTEILEEGNKDYLKNSYLGFVVIRPILDKKGEPLIGRTALKTYPPRANGDKRYYVYDKNTVNLFGLPLSVDSLSFQAQDWGVSACATIGLWTSLQCSADAFGLPKHSPAEITELATSMPEPVRRFPSSGLTIEQIMRYINLLGLDVDIIKIDSNEMVTLAVKAYIKKARIPLLAELELEKNLVEYLHLAVISGYRCRDDGEITELFVHDDQIGPYSKTKKGMPSNSFLDWENEWITVERYDYQKLILLFVPVYPKIRLSFNSMYSRLQDEKAKYPYSNVTFDLYLTNVKDYKEDLLTKSMEGDIEEIIRNKSIMKTINKSDILTMFLPRFLWIIRLYRNNRPVWEDLYDGTSIYPEKKLTVRFT